MAHRSRKQHRRRTPRIIATPVETHPSHSLMPPNNTPIPKEPSPTSSETAEKQKDGTGAFIALASFAIAQGSGLTVVAKGEGRELTVLSIYVLIVAVTAIWIIVLLRSRLPGSNAPAYDSTSLRYGRCTLGWTVLLAAIMLYLACNRLLPNQTNRTAYLGRLDSDTYFLASKRDDALAMLTTDVSVRNDLQMWIAWLVDMETQTQSQSASSTPPQPISQRFIWIEQRGRFQDYYKDIAATITYDRDRFRLTDRVAFLIGQDKEALHPRYRPVLFRREAGMFSDTMDIPGPDPNDSVIIIAKIEAKDGGSVTDDVKQFKIAIANAK